MSVEDAVYAYNEADAARRAAVRIVNRTRDELLEALGIPRRYSTIGNDDEGRRRWAKEDVDAIRHLSPSQRKRLRLLKGTLK